MSTCVEPIQLPRDGHRLVGFLSGDEWPFHGRRRLTAAEVEKMDFSSSAIAAFWVLDDQRNDVGLIRLLGMDGIETDAPAFDLRIASQHRGSGHGTRATQWLVDYLFTEYPELHRIEAYTRIDNTGMQIVLAKTGFVCEGTLREAWWTRDGEWRSALVYGTLRSDSVPQP
jgi:RimJ/RimL family protein N-acetyltransferase